MIIPIHKKGDQSDPNNLRGITLTSCFSKLFTIVSNERLKLWADENSVLTDAQFGFKNNYGCIDPVFILKLDDTETNVSNEEKKCIAVLWIIVKHMTA